ncbi:MAG: NUDIX hydrolase [Anaerolineae bacterium]|nr:NUDIX hydrolase [Anaerolineae bacterium]
MPFPQDMNFCPRCGHPLTNRLKFGKMRHVCEKCAFIYFHDPVVAVVVFVIQDDRVLLVRRAVIPERGKWAFPAGYIDYDDDPRQAAVREVLEETGLEIHITRVIDILGRDRTPGAKTSIAILFEGEVVGGVLSAQDDASEAAFFALEDLPTNELAAFESVSLLIERWKARNHRR